MEAEGLGKDMEFRTLSRGQLGLASLMGKVWSAQGTKGKPVEQQIERDGEVEEADSSRRSESRLLHTPAGDFSFVRGCKLQCLQRPGYIQFFMG